MANEYMGWQRHLFLTALETTWGTIPGTPAYFQVPVEEYSVKVIPESRQSMPTMGIRQRRHNQIYRRRLDGSLTCPLYAHTVTTSIAEKLITWAFNFPAGLDLDARTAEWFDSVELKRQTGLRVNTCTIEGSESSGNCTISLGLMGKDETSVSAGSAQALSGSYVPERSEFLFPDAVFTLGGSATSLVSFRIMLNNNLKENFMNSTTRTLLSAGDRHVDFEFVLKHNATTRDTLNRTTGTTSIETTASLVLKGLHNGTGAAGDYATATATFARPSFQIMDLQGDRNSHVTENTKYIALKPVSSSNEIDWAFGTA